jgi:DNA-binding MarR family transcriptional regulator
MAKKSASPRNWTFLSNHGHVLVYLSRNTECLVKDIAVAVGITERSAQMILADLEDSGYITTTRVGRRNIYALNSRMKFRHPAEANKPISALLNIFAR